MRVLVPLDLSPVTGAVLDTTRAVARASHAAVWLLHVGEPDPSFVGYAAASDAVRGQVAREYREEHRALQAHADSLRADGIETTALLIRGPTAETILREAQRLQSDLIVMATHGHSAMFDLLVGSVSHAVLRSTRIPVMLVPARAA